MQPIFYTFSNKIRYLSKVLAFLAILHLISALLFLSAWGYGGTEDSGSVLFGFGLLGLFIALQLEKGNIDAGIYFLVFYMLCLCASIGISVSILILLGRFTTDCHDSDDHVRMMGVYHMCPQKVKGSMFDFLGIVSYVANGIVALNFIVAFALLFHVFRELRKVMIPQNFDSAFVRTKTRWLLLFAILHTLCGGALGSTFSPISTIIGVSITFCGALGVFSAVATLRGRFAAAKGCLQLYYISCMISFCQALLATTFVFLISKDCRELADNTSPTPSPDGDADDDDDQIVQVLGQAFSCSANYGSWLNILAASCSAAVLPLLIMGFFLAKSILSNIVLVLQPPMIAEAARRLLQDQGGAAIKIWSAFDGSSKSDKSPRIVGLGESISPPPSVSQSPVPHGPYTGSSSYRSSKYSSDFGRSFGTTTSGGSFTSGYSRSTGSSVLGTSFAPSY